MARVSIQYMTTTRVTVSISTADQGPLTFRKALWQEGCQAQISDLDLPAVPIDVDLHKGSLIRRRAHSRDTCLAILLSAQATD